MEKHQESNPEQNQSQYNQDDYKRMWAWVLHEDNLQSNRDNYFMIVISIIFAGLLNLASNDKPNVLLVLILWLVGCYICFHWGYVSLIQRLLTIYPIQKRLRALESFQWYADISEHRKKYNRIHEMLGILFPWIMVIVLTITLFLIL
ncbi:hypothetical protein JW960_00335 [candidate division KSB1 bacterium]|nr:hypothetical protein [candidate division KSB1 bacterium]